MRIVVTGATGNVGTALLRRWATSGHELVAVARRVPPRAAAYGHRWVSLDLADPDQALGLREVLQGADVAVHLAWALQPMGDRGYQRRVNLGGSTMCLAEAVRAGVGQVVVASSVAAYSPRSDHRLVDESYPTDGIPSCGYSQDKRALESIIADLAAGGGLVGPQGKATRLASVRPALIGQRGAGSQMLRMGLPLLTPASAMRYLPILFIDRNLRLQVVHADDVAQAIARIVETGSDGPFNLVAPELLGADEVAAAFGARSVHLPWRVTRAAASLAWRARVGPLDPAWITMAHTVPWVSAERARRELGWRPEHSALQVLTELAEGMAQRSAGGTPPLRRRTHADDLARLVREGPVSTRPRT